MRKYEPIWIALKDSSTKEVSLAATPIAHRRIVLAVRKEKTKDIGWKYQCLEQRDKYKLIDTSVDSLLTFTLERVQPSSLTIHDL
jgi:hypothetical protein